MPELYKKDFTFKTEPLKHQLEALCKSATKTNFAYLMEMGCVDGETEFLTQKGWVKFKDFDLSKWESPLLVGQALPPVYASESKQIFSFTTPISYIKKTVNKMYHFYGRIPTSPAKPCLDIMVTPEHNMRCRLVDNIGLVKSTEDDITAEDLKEWIDTRPETYKTENRFKGPRGQIMQRCFETEGVLGIKKPSKSALAKLSEWEMRVMTAVMADGNFPNKTNNRCVIEFVKQEKIDRFEMLCRKAGIVAVKEIIRGGKSVRFQLVAPVKKKIYDEEFWLLPNRLLHTIFSEIFYWDGSMEPIRNRFFTIHKQSADFIQFLGFIHGYRTSISESVSNNAPYYTVTLNPKANFDDECKYDIYTTVMEYEEVNEEQTAYCFRMPSGQLVLRRNNKIFITGNSGKTKVMIDNMAYLKKRGAISAAIILAPKGVYRNWSTQEIPKHMPEEVNPDVIVWKADASPAAKKKQLEHVMEYKGDTFPILLFNIESLLSDTGTVLLNTFFKVHKGTVMGIVDESTCIKNHKAKRTKQAMNIGAKCRVRRIATGAPVTNSPLDLYSQFAFLDKAILGCGSYYAFRNVYADIERVTNRQGQSYDKIIQYKNLRMLGARIKNFSYRITKKECLDLPEKIYTTRDVELTPEQKALYKEMKDLSFSMYEGQIMSVQVALTKILRLHQILCGSYTADDGEVKKIPNNRLSALEETLDETGGKVIIWANYLQNIKDISEMLTKKYGAESFVKYIGEVSSDDRVEAVRLFQNMNSPVRFFLANVKTAGRGLTLTAANTVVYFSNDYNLELRQQSEDRAHRVGQTNPVTYIDLIVRDSIDEKIIKALLAKRNIAEEILQDGNLDDWITL